MKRFLVNFLCLAIICVGAASAWADCGRFNFITGDHDKSPRALPGHDNHSDSHHDHSHETFIHCPTLDEFVLTGVFSMPKDSGKYRVTNSLVVALNSQLIRHVFGWFTHGPPGLTQSRPIPPYLLLSVLRI
jgi:hypothetical protein